MLPRKQPKTTDNKSNNNWTANHVASFESRAGEFLSWSRALCNCVQETCTNWYKTDRHTCKFLVLNNLHEFLVQVSWACVGSVTKA